MRFGELHRVSLHAYALWLGAEENEESASKVIKSLFGICILSRFASRRRATPPPPQKSNHFWL